MKRTVLIVLLFSALAFSSTVYAQTDAQLIEQSLTATPRRGRDDASVVKWAADHTYTTIKQGTNKIVCYSRADERDRPPFAVQCTSLANLERVAQNRRFHAESTDAEGERALVAAAARNGTRVKAEYGSWFRHIGLSFADLAAKMQELEAAGVTIVTPLREAPGLFKLAFVEDPWGTRIEVVEDPASLGFHHVHLRSANPEATLTWYHTLLGGQRATLKGRLDGLLYGKAWLLATRQTEGRVAPSEGRAIDHLAFAVANLERAAADIREQGVQFTREPWVLENGPFAKASTIISPDGVRVEVVEPFQQ